MSGMDQAVSSVKEQQADATYKGTVTDCAPLGLGAAHFKYIVVHARINCGKRISCVHMHTTHTTKYFHCTAN